MPVEVDLKHEFLQRDLYLVRGVQAEKLSYPSNDPAELLAFAMVVHGQASWTQLLRLTRLLPRDKNLRWKQTEEYAQQPHKFTTGAWNRGPMTGLTLTTRSFPWVTCVLASIVSTWDDSLHFSTVTLTLNIVAHPHGCLTKFGSAYVSLLGRGAVCGGLGGAFTTQP